MINSKALEKANKNLDILLKSQNTINTDESIENFLDIINIYKIASYFYSKNQFEYFLIVLTGFLIYLIGLLILIFKAINKKQKTQDEKTLEIILKDNLNQTKRNSILRKKESPELQTNCLKKIS